MTGAAIFVFVKHLFDKPVKIGTGRPAKAIRIVSGCCMGVWLSHSMAITLVSYFTHLPSSNYIYRFLLPPVVFAACVAGTYVVKKIPILKHIV